MLMKLNIKRKVLLSSLHKNWQQTQLSAFSSRGKRDVGKLVNIGAEETCITTRYSKMKCAIVANTNSENLALKYGPRHSEEIALPSLKMRLPISSLSQSRSPWSVRISRRSFSTFRPNSSFDGSYKMWNYTIAAEFRQHAYTKNQ